MIIDLKGEWKLFCEDKEYNAKVPGCNYLDLLRGGYIADPFVALNEKSAHWIADKDCVYSREFFLDKAVLEADYIELCANGLDTLCAISINGEEAATASNAYQSYRIDIKELLCAGLNSIEIRFLSPVKYVKELNKREPLVTNFMGLDGIQHLRKPAYHFGWDWGPSLPLSGIVGDICIDAYSARIEDIRTTQTHKQGKVALSAAIRVKGTADGIIQRIILPRGSVIEEQKNIDGNECCFSVIIEKPELWYPNGMGEQPLYVAEYILTNSDEIIDKRVLEIGLRTIELDTAKDQYGSNFCFVVNGKKVFAKGANWIPSDSFVNRTRPEDIEFYIKSAAQANMNMLRVWGGGYYESDLFYELCDRYGILVWQDFCYACYPYPFYDSAFSDNALREAEDNIKRLRHHASLALWCGNNEIELMSALWFYRTKLKAAQKIFFYKKLKAACDRFDGITPYWAGSPSSGAFCVNTSSDDYGDTHLWQVWHGLRRPEYYRKRQSRFVSEFGLEALPTMHAVKSFADKKDYSIKSSVMLAHQKCAGGNGKMLYYLMREYACPEKFEDMVYLSGLTQAYAVKKAVLGWRKAIDRVNGALYWQYNDCWPVSSWASIDYTKSYKALQYFAKKFFASAALYLEKEKDTINIFVLNDNEKETEYRIRQRILSFDGREMEGKSETVKIAPRAVTQVGATKLNNEYKKQKKQLYLAVEMYDGKGTLVASERELFVKDKQALFLEPVFSTDIKVSSAIADIVVKSNVFARNVLVNIEGLASCFKDNYVDIDAGQEVRFEIELPDGWDERRVIDSLTIQCVNNIKREGAPVTDFFKRLGIVLYPPNLINALAQLFN